jgi:hypothetical protein
MDLNSWENSKTYFNAGGNQTFIRDNTKPIVLPSEPTEIPQPEIKVVMNGEPSLEFLKEEVPVGETIIKKSKKK